MAKNKTTQQKILIEDHKYKDIIQFGFFESYENLTIKSLALIRWTAINCPFVKFIFKADDDIFIKSKGFISLCENFSPNAIYGIINRNSKVYRESKWAISEIDYPNQYYPTYMSSVYLIPGMKS